MKKNSIISLALIMLVSVSSLAQAKFMMGAKGGLNFSSIDATASLGEIYKSSTGYHGGLFATIKVAKIGIQPEVLFSKQGYIVENTNGKEVFDYKYMNVPILIKWYMIRGLNLQVGPQVSLLTSGVLIAIDGTKTDQTGVLNDKVWSLCAGLGFDLPFKINIDARYVIGLTDVNNTSSAKSAIKSRVFQLSLGYRFLDKG